MQAFEKNPKDADTLANLVAVSLHLGKPAGRYMSQVRPAGCFVVSLRLLSQGSAQVWSASGHAAAAVTVKSCCPGPPSLANTIQLPAVFALPPSPRPCAPLLPSQTSVQLKLVAPTHAIVKRCEEGEAAFDRAASAVSA